MATLKAASAGLSVAQAQAQMYLCYQPSEKRLADRDFNQCGKGRDLDKPWRLWQPLHGGQDDQCWQALQC